MHFDTLKHVYITPEVAYACKHSTLDIMCQKYTLPLPPSPPHSKFRNSILAFPFNMLFLSHYWSYLSLESLQALSTYYFNTASREIVLWKKHDLSACSSSENKAVAAMPLSGFILSQFPAKVNPEVATVGSSITVLFLTFNTLLWHHTSYLSFQVLQIVSTYDLNTTSRGIILEKQKPLLY